MLCENTAWLPRTVGSDHQSPLLELQRQREVRGHQVSASRAGQQGLSRFAIQAMEQYISRGVALFPGRISYCQGHLSLS